MLDSELLRYDPCLTLAAGPERRLRPCASVSRPVDAVAQWCPFPLPEWLPLLPRVAAAVVGDVPDAAVAAAVPMASPPLPQSLWAAADTI